MAKLERAELVEKIGELLGEFQARRLERIRRLEVRGLLARKNPYLFRALNVRTPAALVEELLEAHLSSQDETQFGTVLEQLAIFVCAKVFGGYKSAATGIDMEVTKGNVHYLVSIKSGPNWANSGQLQQMLDDFRRARRILNTNTQARQVVAVNGCTYGRDSKPQKEEYLKLCGQAFWEFCSGRPDFYEEIGAMIGEQAGASEEAFLNERRTVAARMAQRLEEDFCNAGGQIDWGRVLAYNSSAAAAAKK